MSNRMQRHGRRSHALERGPENALAWRARRLRAAGFHAPLAAKLASDWRFDLHALVALTDQGCAPELAARIVAPLDADSPA